MCGEFKENGCQKRLIKGERKWYVGSEKIAVEKRKRIRNLLPKTTKLSICSMHCATCCLRPQSKTACKIVDSLINERNFLVHFQTHVYGNSQDVIRLQIESSLYNILPESCSVVYYGLVQRFQTTSPKYFKNNLRELQRKRFLKT